MVNLTFSKLMVCIYNNIVYMVWGWHLKTKVDELWIYNTFTFYIWHLNLLLRGYVVERRHSDKWKRGYCQNKLILRSGCSIKNAQLTRRISALEIMAVLTCIACTAVYMLQNSTKTIHTLDEYQIIFYNIGGKLLLVHACECELITIIGLLHLL